MKNNIINFEYNSKQVRTQLINNDSYFCLTDCCDILNLRQPSRVLERLEKDGVTQSKVIDNLGREQQANFINEPNLYRVIFRSDKPEAKSFQNWVFSDVLPTLRKTGKYELTSAVKYSLTTQNQPDDKGFYLYPLTCATSPSTLRYKIIDGTIYFKASDIDSILEISRRDWKSNTRTDTNYTIHHILQDIGITPYSFDYLLNIWQILELCNHIKTKRAELLENILSYKVKPYFERKIKAIQPSL